MSFPNYLQASNTYLRLRNGALAQQKPHSMNSQHHQPRLMHFSPPSCGLSDSSTMNTGVAGYSAGFITAMAVAVAVAIAASSPQSDYDPSNGWIDTQDVPPIYEKQLLQQVWCTASCRSELLHHTSFLASCLGAVYCACSLDVLAKLSLVVMCCSTLCRAPCS